MDLFRDKVPRSILFGMKLTRLESEWLQTRALKEGLSKSSLVRKLLAELASNEGEDAGQKR
jgi:hypothetical protein